MSYILVVEDETAIADTLVYTLQSEGFDCSWVSLGADALSLQKEKPADLWILDIGLPDLNGFEVCKQLRQFSEIPVIFLTARNSEIDKVVGLEIGADDYVVKPFSPREVVARVKAILKRVAKVNESPIINNINDEVFRVDDNACMIYFGSNSLNLTRHEFYLFRYLLSQPKRVFSREQLLDALGVAVDIGYERNIDSHIKTLRAKIRALDSCIEVIRTHRGFGYSYDPSQE